MLLDEAKKLSEKKIDNVQQMDWAKRAAEKADQLQSAAETKLKVLHKSRDQVLGLFDRLEQAIRAGKVD